MRNFQVGNEVQIQSHVIGIPKNVPLTSTKAKRRMTKLKPGSDQRVRELINRQVGRDRVVKYFDSPYFSAGMPLVPTIDVLTHIPQGVAQSQRIADTVYIERIELRFTFVVGLTDGYDTCRVVLFIWKQDSTLIVPISNSIFQNPSVYGPHTPLNFEHRKLYSVLKDYYFSLAGTNTVPTTHTNRQLMEIIGIPEHRIDFTIGAPGGTGHIYITTMSDSASSPNPQIQGMVRVWYYDD